MSDRLLIVTKSKYYAVTSENDTIVSSDLLFLSGKPIKELWRWARTHYAKVYNQDYLPSRLVEKCPIACRM